LDNARPTEEVIEDAEEDAVGDDGNEMRAINKIT